MRRLSLPCLLLALALVAGCAGDLPTTAAPACGTPTPLPSRPDSVRVMLAPEWHGCSNA